MNISGHTQPFAVLGHPIGHTLSPVMHNASFAALGLDAIYLAFDVKPERLMNVLPAMRSMGFGGVNLTIPHKEAILNIADIITDRAALIGAANTLTFGADGAIHADNTDAPGFLAALPAPPARGGTALVLGAGGSARAVVHALVEAGVDVAVWNRTAARAAALTGDLGGRAVAAARPADLLVNCTAVGLGQASTGFEELPLTADSIGTYATVVDLVYRPGGTPFLDAAQAAGCSVVDGLEMLVQQGALSLEAWTGLPAPIRVMREVVRRDLPIAPLEPRPSPSATRGRAIPPDGGGARP